jgi:predicted nuclease of restriction endonuclease-like (RecB) superfamily
MNYYEQIKGLLISNEIYKKVKDYSKNKSDVETYYNVGKLIVEAQGGKVRAKYGDKLIKEYSKKLILELNDKKYSYRNLINMRKFYLIFSDRKVNALRSQLSWSHYRELLPIKNVDEIIYYINLAINNNLGYRELGRRIKSKEYNRLPIETKNKLIHDENIEIKDLVPNPILIRNKDNIEVLTEKALHQLILEDIESFMKELGGNLSFVGSEYKIKIGDRNHHIDLLLFNIKYNCYVVVELKVTEFKVEYISQVQKYMNYIDKNIKETSNNTMGILICKRENKFVIEYCSDDRIAVREYELV